MKQSDVVRLAAVMGFLAVALGAFGAHGLAETLTRHQTLEIWNKAVLYHLTHAILLYFLANSPNFHRGPWICFAVGILLFSGSLYIYGVTGVKWWGRVTPLGGVGLLAGWAWLAFHRFRTDTKLI